MKKNYIKCNKHRKRKDPKVTYIFDEIVLFIICEKCDNNMKNIFKEQERINSDIENSWFNWSYGEVSNIYYNYFKEKIRLEKT